ncbi:hypothetical protein H2200_008582 [Cladophialophora chaetospira]|uniref:Uncharacterized protein n=1 Tax=Cladophialophora chaetospira TaxID=386627 RepID=A0AA38X4A8_9EURO|nr:hypothetical protein H2200_008582 [Cladophialophora chaetospira]
MDIRPQVRSKNGTFPWTTISRDVTSGKSDMSRSRETDLEIYLSRALGIALLTIGIIVVLFTGTTPLASSISEPVSLEDNNPKAPYARPILWVTTFYHGISFIYCYTRYVNYQQTGFVLGAVGYGIVACVGLWTLIFGDTKARLSKRTGADKRTSGWPFKNTQAYDKRKDRKMG